MGGFHGGKRNPQKESEQTNKKKGILTYTVKGWKTETIMLYRSPRKGVT